MKKLLLMIRRQTILLIALLIVGCEDRIEGCMDETACNYSAIFEKADNLEPDVAAKFLSYPIPKAIVEEWEKVI